MHIGIVYYSLTGTTEEFAGRIANSLIKERYNVEMIKIETDVRVTGPGQTFKVLNPPDCTKFDWVLFGGPVWAFRACPVTLEAIKNSRGLENKKVLLFVTMGFPFKILGGSQAINKMTRAAQEHGATVQAGFIITRLFHDFKADMDKAVEAIVKMIKGA
ncbi:MAG: hypothetical protein ABIL39_05075 [candidate division WOR-3 bacterium]